MTRTVLLNGRNISRQKELYYTVLKAQKRAISKVRSGLKTALVDAAARDYIEQQGHGDHFGHGTGHGVGLAVHERPGVSWRNKEVIRNNMVFTIEPGIYIPGFGGVRIEDMVIVQQRRAELLTSLPKRLEVIG
jgi:Xaa-Pro aminopeptidase